MTIIPCSGAQLDAAADLFNQYRMFYQQPDDLPGCRRFLADNLAQERSKLFLAFDATGQAVGFAQLYPSQCSIAMRPYYYLSDLFVLPAQRRHGHARRLMEHLTRLFTHEGAQRLTLDTATTNTSAQRLYESLGYVREDVYITYHQLLGPNEGS